MHPSPNFNNYQFMANLFHHSLPPLLGSRREAKSRHYIIEPINMSRVALKDKDCVVF